jgi:small subunit ribosomal protein S21
VADFEICCQIPYNKGSVTNKKKTVESDEILDEEAQLEEEEDESQQLVDLNQIIQHKGVCLEVQVENDNLDRALKVLKRKLIREGVFKEYKSKKYFEKPSVKRKRLRNETLRKIIRIESERLKSYKVFH